MGLNIESKGVKMLENEQAETEVTEVEQAPVSEVINADDWSDANPEEVDADTEQEAETEEVELFLGDDLLESPTSEEQSEDDDKSAPDWVKKLRAEYKEVKRENKELKEKAAKSGQKEPAAKPVEMQPKPRLEEYDYDEDAFTEAVEKWTATKAQVEAERLKQDNELNELKRKHEVKVEAYKTRKAALKIKDFDVAERVVIAEVPEVIQGQILHYSDTPEIVVLALGRSKDLREKAAKITDPVELGRFIGSIEARAKVAPKPKNSPAPTPKVSAQSGAGKQDAADKALHKAFPDAIIR